MGRAATNDYFDNRLVDRLFFRLIEQSDKKPLLHILSNVFQTNVPTE